MLASSLIARAQSPQLAGEQAINFGDIAATGFAGTKLQLDALPPGVDPVSKTVIDPDGSTLQVLDGASLAGPLTGQKSLAPARLEFKAREIGHVFGLAFDNSPVAAPVAAGTPSASPSPGPSLFAAATSAFGLHIVGPDKDGDGKPDRLEKGAPGATFMEGQFGAPAGSPGSIWKIDRATGAASLFADLASGGVKNSGPGIGALAFDPASRTLYASDLDTGLIHRLSVANAGADQGQFDFGVTARPLRGKPAIKDDGKRLDIASPSFDAVLPSTWGFTQRERRIDGLAVHNGRLYFAVAEGPEIWSVGLEADGAFKTDARFETGVDSEQPFPVTSIAFDRDGRMIVAQRGDVQNAKDYSSFVAAGPARVLRFTAENPDAAATPGLWQIPPEEYAVGNGTDNRSSSGGVALEYNLTPEGAIDTNACSGTIVASADALGAERAVHGVQLAAVGLVRPANVPPTESAFVNWNAGLDDAQARGYAGGVAVLHSCTGDAGAGFPELAAGAEGPPELAAGAGEGLPELAGGGGAAPPVVDPGGAVTDPTLPVTEETQTGGGGKVQIGPLTLEKTPVSTSCNETDPCTFEIKVTNTSAAPLPGPITIKDVFSVGDAPLTARISGTPNAPWTCAAEAPGVSCKHPGPLQPNVPETLTLSFIPGPLGAATEVKNCVTTATAPAPAPQQQGEAPPPPDEGDTVNGLNVVTKALSTSCDVNVPCTLQVTAKNVSAAPMTGGRAIFILNSAVDSAGQTERVGMINVLGSGPPGFTCTEGAALDGQAFCEVPQFTLAPNAAITATFIVKAGGRATGAPFDSFEFLGGFQIGVRDTPGFGESAHIGSVPKTGAAAPAGANPVAPGKKSEVPAILRSLVQLAAFTSPSPDRNRAHKRSLFTLAGGAGGNIGGVTNRCLEWGNLNNGFVVRQSDNITVSFLDMKYVDGRATGRASYIRNTTGNERANVSGTVSGTMTPEGNLRLTVEWNDGQRGVYAGRVDEAGNLTGTVSSGGVKSRTMTGEPKWWRCARNELCEAYATQASNDASNARTIKCVAEGEGGRWTKNKQEHLDFCMSRKPSDPIIVSEREARTTQYMQCIERVKKQAEDCTELGKEGVAKGQEFKDRGCGEPDPILSTDLPTQYTAVCVPHFDGKREGLDPQYVAGIRQARQERLDACIARLAAGGQPAPAPVPPADPGPAPVPPGGPGQTPPQAEALPPPGTSPPPQACAVVPVEPKEVTGDPVPQGNGLTLLKEPVTADCSGPTGCEFKITLKNEGATPVSGITLVDTPTGDGDFAVVSDGLAVSPGAAWVCQKGFPKKCTREGALAAGATDTFNFGMTLSGPNQTATAMRNCVIVEPAAGAPAPTPACADMKVKPPPGALTISKAPANGVTSCVDNTDCRFVITLTNNSPAPRDGEVKIIETVSDGEGALFGSAEISTPMPAPWKCVKTGQTFECKHPGPLPPGSISPSIGVKLGPGTAAKAVKNCVQIEGQAGAPACATVPIGPPPKQLVIANNPVADKCSDIGGGCDYVVSITNNSDTDFTNPIAFNALASTADGRPLPNADYGNVGVSGATANDISAPFICTKNPGGVTCATGALKVKIPANRTITFPMSITPGPAGGATAVQNCAQLLLDQFGDQVCRNIPLVNGPLLRAFKVTAAQSCFPECAFAVGIRNVGNADAKTAGAFGLFDTFKPADTLGDFTTSSDDFNCGRSINDPKVINCNSKKQILKPGEVIRATIVIKTKTVVPEYENCADVGLNDAFTVDNTHPGRCVIIKQPISDQIGPSPIVRSPPNIAVTMPPPEQKICAIRGNIAPGGLPKGNCIFVAQFTNKGDQAFEGTLAYDVTTNRHTATSSRHRTLNCITPGSTPATIGNPQTSQCELSGNTRLVKDGALSVAIDIEPGEGWVKDNVVEVCTKFSYRSKSNPPDPGTITDDDRACQTIKLDPFAVRVSKTGDQQCPPGSDCTFKLTLFNPGPIDHNDPVTITDSLTGLSSAQIVSITPPLPCATQPTQIPFTCTSPGPVRLDLDAPPGSEFGPREFVMVVKLPNDASAEQFSNCATVGDDKASSDPSCAVVATKPAPAGPCIGGQVMTARGCACPAPTKWNGQACTGPGGVKPTPPSTATPPPPPPPPVVAAPPPSCSGGMILVEGSCACPPFMKWNGRACVGTGGPSTTKAQEPPVATAPASCSGGMILVEGTCACPPSMRWNGRACVGTGGINTTPASEQPRSEPPKTSTPSCPDDRPVGTFPNCCPANSRQVGRECQCLEGFESRRGLCRPVRQTEPRPAPPTSCPADKPVGRPPNCCPLNSRQVGRECQCLPGFEARRGQCRPAPQCPPNSRRVGNECQCLPGFEMRRRVCRPVKRECPPNLPVGEFPRCCPLNARFVGNRCECQPGFVNRRGQCRPAPTQPPRPQPDLNRRVCPDGTVVFGKFTKCPGGPRPTPTPTPTPTPVPTGPSPKPTPPPPTCTRGFVLQNGKCVCPGVFLDGQCVR